MVSCLFKHSDSANIDADADAMETSLFKTGSQLKGWQSGVWFSGGQSVGGDGPHERSPPSSLSPNNDHLCRTDQTTDEMHMQAPDSVRQ